MANLRFWFTYLLHTLQLVAAQSTVQRNFGDGSYCLHCSASNALDALGCDLAFVFSGCFFGALLGDLGTCGVPSYSSASGKSCYSLGSCATSCTGADASGYYLDYCCFLPGSPFITPYLAGTTPPTPSPTKSTVPTPTASSKGITCNIVDTLANEYAAAAAGGPDALGYYGQVLNLACLRSTCINPACQRVASVRSTDPECANLGGSFDFEQAVFGKFTQNVDLNKVTHDAAQFQTIGQVVSAAFNTGLVSGAFAVPPPLRLLLLAITQSGFTDSKTWATVVAGTSHFWNDLGPNFNSYIKNLVTSSPDDATLAAKISALKAEHDLLFKCAVSPGFEAQVAQGELSLLPAFAGSITVPIAAQLVRDVELYNALVDLKGMSRPEAIEATLGIKLPSISSLQWDPRNWIDTSGLYRRDIHGRLIGSTAYSQKGMTTSLTEISMASGLDILISLDLASSFKVDVNNQKPTSDGCMARSMLFYPSAEQPPRSPIVLKVEGNDVSIIGPIGSIYPASYQMVFYNTSHIIPSNISDPLIPISSLTNAPGVASKGPVSPTTDGTPLMYNTATVSLSFNPVYVSGMSHTVFPETDITIFDLVTGLPLKSVSYTPSAGGGIFSAPLQPGDGMWGGHWGSGGSFALGLKGNTATSTLSSSSSTISSPKTSMSTSSSPVALSSSQTKSTSSSTRISSSIAPTSTDTSLSTSSTNASASGTSTLTMNTFTNSSQFSSKTTSSSSGTSISTSSNIELSPSTPLPKSTSTSFTSQSSASDFTVVNTSTSHELVVPTATSSSIYNNKPITTIIVYTTTSICPVIQTLTSGSLTTTRSTYSLSTITFTSISTIPCNSGCKNSFQTGFTGKPTTSSVGGLQTSQSVTTALPATLETSKLNSIAPSLAKTSSVAINAASNLQTPKVYTSSQPSPPTIESVAKASTPLAGSQNTTYTARTGSQTVTGTVVVPTLSSQGLSTSTTQAGGVNGSMIATIISLPAPAPAPAVTGSAAGFKAGLGLLNIYTIWGMLIVTGIIVL